MRHKPNTLASVFGVIGIGLNVVSTGVLPNEDANGATSRSVEDSESIVNLCSYSKQ